MRGALGERVIVWSFILGVLAVVGIGGEVVW